MYDTILEGLYSPTAANPDVTCRLLAEDAGIQPLLPYLVQMATEQVTRWIASAQWKLMSIPMTSIRVLFSVLSNRSLFPEPYLHQMMPVLLTCLLCEFPRNSDSPSFEALHYDAARTLQLLCGLYSEVYAQLVPRCCKTLEGRLSDHLKGSTASAGGSTLSQGAIIGAMALGAPAIETCILPHFAILAQDPALQKYLQDALKIWQSSTLHSPDKAASFGISL